MPYQYEVEFYLTDDALARHVGTATLPFTGTFRWDAPPVPPPVPPPPPAAAGGQTVLLRQRAGGDACALFTAAAAVSLAPSADGLATLLAARPYAAAATGGGGQDAVLDAADHLYVARCTDAAAGTVEVSRCPTLYAAAPAPTVLGTVPGVAPSLLRTPEGEVNLLCAGKCYRLDAATAPAGASGSSGAAGLSPGGGLSALAPLCQSAPVTWAWRGDVLWLALEAGTGLTLTSTPDRGRTQTPTVPPPLAGANVGKPRILVDPATGGAVLLYARRAAGAAAGGAVDVAALRSYDGLQTWTPAYAGLLPTGIPEQWVGAALWAQKLALSYLDAGGAVRVLSLAASAHS